MGTPDLLKHLQSAGLTLAASGDRLIVTPAHKLNEQWRAAIRANKEQLLTALAEAPAAPKAEQAQPDTWHPLWTDAEIHTFQQRSAAFLRRDIDACAAEQLAEKLVLRDREDDDRRLCLECSHLSERKRCLAAAIGRLPNTDKRLEPVLTILQRCPSFGLQNI